MSLKKEHTFIRNAIFLALLYLIIFYICTLFPSTGDDWFREGLGAQLHGPVSLIKEVAHRWQTTNGRILGNVLAYAAGSRSIVRHILRSSIIFALILLAARCIGFSSRRGLILSAVCLFALPREMFREIYPWAAGFFNYVPPVCLTLGFFIIAEHVFTDEKTKRGGVSCVAAFLIGFCGQLFVEHNTVYAIAAGIVLILWYYIREKKLSPVLLLYFTGAILGAALLFASPSYRGMSGGGAYTSALSGGLSGLRATFSNNHPLIIKYLILNCPVLFISMTLLAISLFLRKSDKKPLDHIVLVITALSAAAMIINMFTPVSENLAIASAWIWLVGLFFACLLCMNEGPLREKALFFLSSAVFVALPLLIVEPIGPRCLFASYVFLFLTGGCMLRDFGIKELYVKLSSITVCIVAVAVLTFYLSIFIPIHVADASRLELTREAMEKGEAGVVLSPLPHGDYLWEPDTQKMIYAFYYETPGDLEITFSPNK